MRRAIPGSGAPTTSGWKIAANASTPSTSRGPGPGERRVRVHGPHRYAVRQHVAGDQVAGQLGGSGQVVATGRHHDDLGSGRGDRVPRGPERLLARRPEHAGAAGPRDHLGYPVPGSERRVGPLEDQASGRGRPATAASTRASRSRRPATSCSAACDAAAGPPRVTTDASTSSRVCGSMVSTSARQPRCASASSTTETSTAQTAQRSWVTTRSASRPARAPSSRWYRSSPARIRSLTTRSISAAPRPSGRAESTRSGGYGPRSGSRTRTSRRRHRPRRRRRTGSPSSTGEERRSSSTTAPRRRREKRDDPHPPERRRATTTTTPHVMSCRRRISELSEYFSALAQKFARQACAEVFERCSSARPLELEVKRIARNDRRRRQVLRSGEQLLRTCPPNSADSGRRAATTQTCPRSGAGAAGQRLRRSRSRWGCLRGCGPGPGRCRRASSSTPP